MNLDIVLIDFLAPHGMLTTFRILPIRSNARVTIDRQRDIFPGYTDQLAKDIGGTRIYNFSSCSIERFDVHLRSFEAHQFDHSFSFRFEHMGIPVGSMRQGHGGHYNFVLCPGWRLRDLWVSDPYDTRHESVERKKQFRHNVLWDPECKTQLVEMELSSGRGSFSFIVKGTASLLAEDDPSIEYVQAATSPSSVRSLGQLGWGDDASSKMADELVHVANWVELKPNIAGIGINLNAIIQDSFNIFRRKVTGQR